MFISKDLQRLMRPGWGMSVVEPNESELEWWNGRLLIFEPPEVREEYVLGVDPGLGVGQDRSVCQVIKIGTLDHPAVQVAEFASDFLDPTDFASVLNVVGRFYAKGEDEALAVIEANADCGDTMITDLQMRFDYSNIYIRKAYDRVTNLQTNKYGWWTDKHSRPKIIARGSHAFYNGDLVVNSLYTIDEMSDFKKDYNTGKEKAKSGAHDDRIMALLIGYWGGNDENWLNGEDIDEARRQHTYAKSIQAQQIEESVEKKRGDYQGRPMSYKSMMQEADSRLLEDYEG